MTRACPDCRYPMVTERHLDIDLDLCRNCAGIWFDADELGRLIAADPVGMAALEAKVTPRVTQRKMQAAVTTCPSCDSLLHVYHYQYDSPIELNACLDCGGFWIQEGELEKIQQWRSQYAKPGDEATQSHVPARPETGNDRALSRLESIRRFCSLLRQHQPLWRGKPREEK